MLGNCFLYARDNRFRSRSGNAFSPTVYPLVGFQTEEYPTWSKFEDLYPRNPHDYADLPPNVIKFGGTWPLLTAITFATAVSPIRLLDSYVVPATWGVRMTFGKSKKSCHAGGSKSYTSTPYPRSVPSLRAFVKGPTSTHFERAVFTRIVPGFIRENACSSRRWYVDSSRGTCREMMSACEYTSSLLT